MDIKKYTSSGIIERYAAGMAGRRETVEFEHLLQKHPELKQALQRFNQEVDKHLKANAGQPPPGSWAMIEKEIKNMMPL